MPAVQFLGPQSLVNPRTMTSARSKVNEVATKLKVLFNFHDHKASIITHHGPKVSLGVNVLHCLSTNSRENDN